MTHFLHALLAMINLSQAELCYRFVWTALYSDHTPMFFRIEFVVICYLLFNHNYSKKATYQSQKWIC